MKKNPQIFWSVFLLGLVVLIWGFFSFKGNDTKDVVENLVNFEKENKEELPLGEGQEVKDFAFGKNKYSHSILGFSFEYLEDYKISSFGNFFDSTGETILLQKDAVSTGLQILVTPFDEDVSLTINRIKKELPSLVISNAREFKIGGKASIQVVVFESSNSITTGNSLEAWFVYNKNLYQISSPKSSKDLFDTIISSWKLEE